MIEFNKNENQTIVIIEDEFVNYDNRDEISKLFEMISSSELVVFNKKDLTKWDTTLVSLLFQIAIFVKEKKIDFDISKMPENLQNLVNLALKVDRNPTPEELPKYDYIEAIGYFGLKIYAGFSRSEERREGKECVSTCKCALLVLQL